jgi:hypothetical protein
VKLIVIAVFTLLVSTGCGMGNRWGAIVGGGLTEHRPTDTVRCYESQSGSLSCVVVR